MASSEPRAGFRPPWALNVDSSDSTDGAPVTGTAEPLENAASEAAIDDAPEAVAPQADAPEAVAAEAEAPEAVGAEANAPVPEQVAELAEEVTAVEATAEVERFSPEPVQPAAAATHTKFQVDLARAMRAAAETARQEAIERLNVESKARIETIRAKSQDAATELRQRADDDIAEIRDWSKGELSRIRSETDVKITDRKSWLAEEIEAHEESIEALVAGVGSRVTAFEQELERFFERLAAEEDPTRIAAIAGSLPDVPSLDEDRAVATVDSPAAPTSPVVVEDSHGYDEAIAVADTSGAETSTVADTSGADTNGEDNTWAGASWDAPAAASPVETTDDGELDPFAALGRRLAALGLDPESAAAAETDATTELVSDEDAGPAESSPEATLEAAAEAVEAAPAADASTDWGSGAVETIDPPAESVADAETSQMLVADAEAAPTETSVVVDGLISVASIAGFKRSLSRVEGVTGVTVSSGPDGEFVFAVKHLPAADLESALPTMPGFGVRLTNTQSGQINVTAHDPENAASDASFDTAGRRA